jgi:hypothetical protein
MEMAMNEPAAEDAGSDAALFAAVFPCLPYIFYN